MVLLDHIDTTPFLSTLLTLISIFTDDSIDIFVGVSMLPTTTLITKMPPTHWLPALIDILHL